MMRIMDIEAIIQQLETSFRSNLDRLQSLESVIHPTGGDSVSRPKYVAYGTAGFRGRASDIGHLFYKVGLVAGFRSLSTWRANLGIMITASHNPVEDNGVKIIEADGSMLESSWEPIVEKFCNIAHGSFEQSRSLFEHLYELMIKLLPNSINETDLNTGCIMIGHDTRPSCESLLKLVKLGLDAWAPLISYRDYGALTTPALHYLVGESTRNNMRTFELVDYYKKLAEGLVLNFRLMSHKPSKSYDPSQLIVDCANGVGSYTMKFLSKHSEFISCLPLSLINEVGHEGVLNLNCGADFVKTKLLAPQSVNQLNKRYASLDGDADRVVYFYLTQSSEQKQLHLLDGDKILALFAMYLVDILRKYNLTEQLTLGIVQTAYANGASTDYLTKSLGLQVDCVDTGVKHLHKKAVDYDLGLYFEANGHGTIWLSDKARSCIELNEVVELQQLVSVLNNYTGDAISDILIVESILNYYDWNIVQWDKLYEDRPNALTKVVIEDRELVKTTNAGRTCLSPSGLQQKIDELVLSYGFGARCFVRASGTENVVRIYSECLKQDEANRLANSVGQIVIEMCN